MKLFRNRRKEKTNTEKLPGIGPKFNDQYFQLLNTYLTEWCHRDELMWKEIYTYFFAALIVIMAPYLKILDDKFASEIKEICFWAGLVLSLIVPFCGFAYGRRLAHVGDQYRELIEKLPEEYRAVYFTSKKRKHGWYFSLIIPGLMTVALIFLDLCMYHFFIHGDGCCLIEKIGAIFK